MSWVLRLLCCAVLCCSALAQTKSGRDLMLPSPVRLYGVVTDSKGHPLKDVWINHTGLNLPKPVVTDSQGRFDIQTRAPVVVFRSNGFNARYWRVSASSELAIALSGPVRKASECKTPTDCVSMDGTFCLPSLPGLNIGEPVKDTDIVRRWFWFKTEDGRIEIMHGAGGMWSSGWPSDEEVWSARDYSETSYEDPQGYPILDARGQTPEGKYWRVLGHSTETVSYSNRSQQEAAVLDRVLDGVCVAANPMRRTRR